MKQKRHRYRSVEIGLSDTHRNTLKIQWYHCLDVTIAITIAIAAWKRGIRNILLNSWFALSLSNKIPQCNRPNISPNPPPPQPTLRPKLLWCIIRPRQTYSLGNHKNYHNTKIPIIHVFFLSAFKKKIKVNATTHYRKMDK